MNSIIYVGMDVHTTNYTLCCFSPDKDRVFAVAQVEPDYLNILKYLKRVEKNIGKIYYCYRFISEFSGKSIDHDDARVFRHQFYKNGSISSRSLEGISKGIAETKMQIDNILKLLNDATEYRSSESNIKLQWIMMIVTVLSLLVALSSMNNVEIMNKLKGLIEWLNRLLCSILSSLFLH